MLDVGEFIQRIENLKKSLLEALPKLMQVRALEAKAKIVERIQEQGTQADGSAFPAYSKGYLRQKVKAKRYTGKTDLTLSGRMLGSLRPGELQAEGTKVTVSLQASAAAEQAKLTYNEEHYSDILALSPGEIEGLQDNLMQDLINITNKQL